MNTKRTIIRRNDHRANPVTWFHQGRRAVNTPAGIELAQRLEVEFEFIDRHDREMPNGQTVREWRLGIAGHQGWVGFRPHELRCNHTLGRLVTMWRTAQRHPNPDVTFLPSETNEIVALFHAAFESAEESTDE